MPPTFQTRRPFRPHHATPRDPAIPPAPPVARVTHVERQSQEVVRFTLDTAVDDLGGCGDLRVNGDGPVGASLADPFNVDATYPGLPAGPAGWTTEPIDGEPIFANGATIATDAGPVPPWT